ncbi:MAG: hypothetical protein WCO45_01080 [Pseudanabaena sp. ELA607]
MLGGVKRLISHGAANQAIDCTGSNNATTSHNAPTVGLWQNFAGLNLKAGESVVINGESVHFYSWGDSLPSVMQVLPAGVGTNLAFLRQIRAHEVWSIARHLTAEVPSNSPTIAPSIPNAELSSGFNAISSGLDLAPTLTPNNFTQNNLTPNHSTPNDTAPNNAPSRNFTQNQGYSEQSNAPHRLTENTAGANVNPSQPYTSPQPNPPVTPEPPPAPAPNAWEVWTYLERQRQTTLKHLHTFKAEWEANRFVREAERSAPDHLRVHYEIRPVVQDLASDLSSNSASVSSYADQAPVSDPPAVPKAEPSSQVKPTPDHDDAIDVEILDPN